MKKILYLFFTCSIIFAFAGCSPSKKDSAEATTTQEIATTTSSTEDTTDSSTSDSDAKNDSYDFSAYKKRIKKLTKKVNNAALYLEIFNLLDIANVSSYSWVPDLSGVVYAIPNSLTPRLINLKLAVDF